MNNNPTSSRNNLIKTVVTEVIVDSFDAEISSDELLLLLNDCNNAMKIIYCSLLEQFGKDELVAVLRSLTLMKDIASSTIIMLAHEQCNSSNSHEARLS